MGIDDRCRACHRSTDGSVLCPGCEFEQKQRELERKHTLFFDEEISSESWEKLAQCSPLKQSPAVRWICTRPGHNWTRWANLLGRTKRKRKQHDPESGREDIPDGT